MGTRGLTMVIDKKKPVIAQYGQFDHYPSGQGATALNFLLGVDLNKFKNRLKTVRFQTEADEKEIKDFMTSIGSTDGWMNGEQANKYHEKYPYLTRDNGARILELVYLSTDPEIVLVDQTEFAGDSLFCEWAYVIDLDKQTFEVYKGFNDTTPLTEADRFFFLQQKAEAEALTNPKKEERTEYYPVKLLKEYSLTALPMEAQFVTDCEEKEEEETPAEL